MLLVFEARLVGLAAATQSFFGVSFFLIPIFLLGEAWSSTVSSGSVSIVMESSWKGVRCTVWIGTGSLEPVPDLMAKRQSVL